MFNVGEYAKAHPWTVGALVVGGGVAFFYLSGWFSGGSNGSVTVASSGPSAAQLAAGTQVQLATIGAGVQNNQTSAELAAAQIAASVTNNTNNLEYQLGVKQTDAGTTVSLANITASLQALLDTNKTTLGLGEQQTGVQVAQINANSNTIQAIIDAFRPKSTPVPTPVDNSPSSPQLSYWDQWLVNHPDVTAAYPTYLKDQSTWATSGFHTGDTLEQFAQDQYTINAPAYANG